MESSVLYKPIIIFFHLQDASCACSCPFTSPAGEQEPLAGLIWGTFGQPPVWSDTAVAKLFFDCVYDHFSLSSHIRGATIDDGAACRFVQSVCHHYW
jgi:hypothetical protein